MTDSFASLEIDQELIKGLSLEEIKIPTPVQSKVIPLALQNKNIIVQSETGTGKTLAYLVPIFEKLKVPKKEIDAIIMAPTHELVIQIQRQIERLAKNSGIGITSTTLIGNVNIARQIDKLKLKPRIIVGSAGRILELIKMRKILPGTIKTVVLDEADRLLDVNNRDGVLDVVKSVSKERQLMFFSASIQNDTIELAKQISGNLEVIKDESNPVIPDNIRHTYFFVEQQEKIETLRKLIGIIHPKKSIVFLNKSEQVENLLVKLQYHGLKVGALHGTNRKLDRKKVMDDFRTGKLEILIASDIAARGLQMDGITHVFNMDIPETPKEYLHRVGRTGRNNVDGVAISIITEREFPLLSVIQNKFSIKLTEQYSYKGKIFDATK